MENRVGAREGSVPLWSHPDITLAHLLVLVRAYADILLLASGYQPQTGSPAKWRAQDVQNALGWASFLEEIMKRISASKEAEGSREALDTALKDMMADATFPEGLPKLSCEVLSNAKKLLILAMSNATGLGGEQAESLLAAVYGKPQDWELALKTMSERFQGEACIKSLFKVVLLATPILNKRNPSSNVHCCQDWRGKSLSYMLNEETLYKLSGANVLFKSREPQWRAAFQRIASNKEAVVGIGELCCLQLSYHKWSSVISDLMEPCQSLSCSKHLLTLEHLRTQAIEDMEYMGCMVETYFSELLERNETIWWSLPPIMVAAALTKGSPLLKKYVTVISRHAELGRRAEDGFKHSSDAFFERMWCLQFQGLYE